MRLLTSNMAVLLRRLLDSVNTDDMFFIGFWPNAVFFYPMILFHHGTSFIYLNAEITQEQLQFINVFSFVCRMVLLAKKAPVLMSMHRQLPCYQLVLTITYQASMACAWVSAVWSDGSLEVINTPPAIAISWTRWQGTNLLSVSSISSCVG